VDVRGVLRSKVVPAAAISIIQRDGAGFAPGAAWLNNGPEAADMVAIPDPTTLIQVPFQKELGFVMSDCYIDGKKVEDSPRWVLKEQIAKAEAKGYVFKTGVEPEFFLLSPAEGLAISDPRDTQAKPCYDAQAMMRRYSLLKEIVDSLNAAGYGVYQCDHEDANGQFEINWHYRDCLTTADQHVFFKWVVKTLAEKHGLRATFMPRPFVTTSGNGCHCHCSLWTGDTNVFKGSDAGEDLPDSLRALGLSALALQFMGGILSKAGAFCAVTNPTVNSYKRLSDIPSSTGSTWAPNRVSFSGNNRTHMVRVPASDRFEVRVADGAVNPYLLPAVLLAAGMWGLDGKVSPKRFFFEPSVNMYAIPKGASEISELPTMPENLLDALRAMAADADLTAMFGAKFTESFQKLKKAEWSEYAHHLSAWELQNTLDC